jgi:tripartite-type tricarboxylate transporter receptor subunit TctC
LGRADRHSKTGLNFVPYRGTAPAVQDLVAGQIDLLFAPPDVRAGRSSAGLQPSSRYQGIERMLQ